MTTCMMELTDGFKAAIHRLCSLLMLHRASLIENWHQRARGDRKACRINAEVLFPGGLVEATIRNISPGGAGLQIDYPLRPGDSIVLSFAIHYLEPPIKIESSVVWSRHGAAGLEFRSA